MTVFPVGLTGVKVMSPELGKPPKEAGLKFHFTRNSLTEPEEEGLNQTLRRHL